MLKFSKNYKVIDVKQTWIPKMTREELPKATLETRLLTEAMKTLIEHLIKEFDFYFPRPDGD